MFNRATFRPMGSSSSTHAIEQNKLLNIAYFILLCATVLLHAIEQNKLFYCVLEEDPMGSKRRTIKHVFYQSRLI